MTLAWDTSNRDRWCRRQCSVAWAIAMLSGWGAGQAIAIDLDTTGQNAIDLDAMAQVTPVFELSDEPHTDRTNRLGRPDTSLGSTTDSTVNPMNLFLTDVFPNDWAYDAIESLIHRYHIPLGFPDGTYQGDRPLTRYQLAAAMIPVLDRLMEAFLTGDKQLISESDIVLVEQLQEDFQDILAEAEGRLEELEARTDRLEYQEFSTTTVLEGEGILALTDQGGNGDATQTTGQYRLWLDFATHFSVTDALHTRLMISNSESLGQGSEDNRSLTSLNATAEATLIQNSRGNTQDAVELDWLTYSRSLGDRSTPPINLYISAKGGTHSHYVDTLSPFGTGFQGDGAMSVFGQSSPIYTIGGGSGIGAEWVLDKSGKISLAAGYLAEQSADSEAGLFNQDYAALGQLTLQPTKNVHLGLTYVHGYHSPGNAIFDAGLEGAIAGTGIANATHSVLDTSAITHSYGLQTRVDLNRQFSLYGFGGYTDIRFVEQGHGDVWFYGVGLGVENWLLPQTSGGIIIGTEPYLSGLDHPSSGVDNNDTPLHIETFYTLRLSDQVSIAPGFIWLTAPNQNKDNSDRVIATLRTTFQF